MFFDAILNEKMEPVFNGTPEETMTFLTENIELVSRSDYRAHMGEPNLLVSAWEYFYMYH